MKLNWARMFGLQHTYEQAANEHLAWMQEEAFRKSVMVRMRQRQRRKERERELDGLAQGESKEGR